jgi:hypothetical protein
MGADILGDLRNQSWHNASYMHSRFSGLFLCIQESLIAWSQDTMYINTLWNRAV